MNYEEQSILYKALKSAFMVSIILHIVFVIKSKGATANIIFSLLLIFLFFMIERKERKLNKVQL